MDILICPRSDLFRETVYWKIILETLRQKPIENISLHSIVVRMEKLKVLSKGEYLSIMKEKRREFIHKYFGDELEGIFDKLRKDAEKMIHCHHEVSFECPEHFDVDVIEQRLREYFKDMEYETVAIPRKDDTRLITLTLT
jgi:hypothetical protein